MEIDPLNGIQPMATVSVAQPSPEQLAENRQIVTAVKSLNKTELLGNDKEFRLLMDRETQRPVIRLVERDTQQVLWQMPSEYFLNLAKELHSKQRG
jgi:uncharacterized FlaG/YvyC family protein